jgi:hypothetical protein
MNVAYNKAKKLFLGTCDLTSHLERAKILTKKEENKLKRRGYVIYTYEEAKELETDNSYKEIEPTYFY